MHGIVPCLMCSIGCGSAFIAAVIGLYNIQMVLRNSYFRKKYEYQLFFYRFVADFVMTAFSTVYYMILIISLFTTVTENLSTIEYWLGLIVSSAATSRVFTSMLIALERALAVYSPAIFHKYRQRLPNLIPPFIAFSVVAVDGIVLYGPCDYRFAPNLECIVFTCQTNVCFNRYYAMNKTIMYGITGTLFLMLCIKLFVIDKFHHQKSEKLSRVNKLTLIDAVIVFLFDFSSSFIASQKIFTYQDVGPYDAAPKMFGRAIEAIMVSIQLRKSLQVHRDSLHVVTFACRTTISMGDIKNNSKVNFRRNSTLQHTRSVH